MLAAKQNTEKIFFMHFIERAIKGDREYINIVKPILVEAAQCKRKEITICQLTRHGCSTKLDLLDMEGLENITESNLMLNEVLEYVKTWDFFI